MLCGGGLVQRTIHTFSNRIVGNRLQAGTVRDGGLLGEKLYLCNSQQTCSYNLVQRCGGEKVRLIKTFHTLRAWLLTFAHRDDEGLVRKILSCSLTSKKQQVTNFNHQL